MTRIITSIITITICALIAWGLVNITGMLAVVSHVNSHLGGYMAGIMYFSFGMVFFLAPIVVGLSVEHRAADSNTRVGAIVSNAVSNARNSVLSFVALGMFGGASLLLATWGLACIVCA